MRHTRAHTSPVCHTMRAACGVHVPCPAAPELGCLWPESTVAFEEDKAVHVLAVRHILRDLVDPAHLTGQKQEGIDQSRQGEDNSRRLSLRP